MADSGAPPAVPQIAKWREKAYITSMKTDARNVANALEASYVDNQEYPTTQSGFDALVASDVKLNPGSNAYGYWRVTDGNGFGFWVTSNKTDSLATYRSYGSPIISMNG